MLELEILKTVLKNRLQAENYTYDTNISVITPQDAL